MSSRDLRLRWRSAALDEESGLTLGERLTVCVLAEHVNGERGECRLRLATIGEQLGGLHPRHARRLVRGLEAKGWLEIDEHRGRSSTYRPRLPDFSTARTPMSLAPDTHVPGTPDMTPDTHVPQNQKNQKEQKPRAHARARAHTPANPETPRPRHRDPRRTFATIRRWIQSPGFDPEADDDDAVLEEITRRERNADVEFDDALRAELLELAHRRREAAR